ncbi:MAG: GNAT family N-acetyltransferase [Dysgonomonas sp.]|nr:GNAT family N-acetyltransferase [Dysgonomonas sp.]
MPNTLTWLVNSFDELDIHSLYKILYLRTSIFIVEQDTVYYDLDNKDQKALHVQGYLGDKLVAYCRLFKRGDYFEEASIGRIVVAKEYRRYGYGDQLLERAIELEKTLLNETKITISAQLYLKKFYESHGFRQTSDTYLEDGIPHLQMKRD